MSDEQFDYSPLFHQINQRTLSDWARINQYRRACLILAGGDRTKVRAAMLQAEAQAQEEPEPLGGRCPHGGSHQWTAESEANGWRSSCRICGLRAQGSGQ